MLVRLPWTAPVKAPEQPRRLNKDRRRHLVNLIAAILKAGDPTPFAFEATCRNGLRTRFCLAGWDWAKADSVATDIVLRALMQIGAQRPTWDEGQPEYSQQGAGALIERTRCIRCHSRLEGIQRKFCSDLCGAAHYKHVASISKAETEWAYDKVVKRIRIWSDAP